MQIFFWILFWKVFTIQLKPSVALHEIKSLQERGGFDDADGKLSLPKAPREKSISQSEPSSDAIEASPDDASMMAREPSQMKDLKLPGAENAKKVLLDIPGRQMWGWGPGKSGYSGSCTTQMVGIYFGNYVSQDQVRAIAGGDEILIEKNLLTALASFQYNFTAFESTKKEQYKNFIIWLKSNLDMGHPVIVGVFWKGPTSSHRANGMYDHIIPIVGYSSQDVVRYHDDDIIYWYDLYQKEMRSSKVIDWVRTRETCVSQTLAPKQPYDYCLPKEKGWGVAVYGNRMDKEASKLVMPSHLRLPNWQEPDFSREDEAGEKPVSTQVKVDCGNLTPKKQYVLLRYNASHYLPQSDFLKSDYERQFPFTAKKPIFSTPDNIQTDSTMFYRCILDTRLPGDKPPKEDKNQQDQKPAEPKKGDNSEKNSVKKPSSAKPDGILAGHSVEEKRER